MACLVCTAGKTSEADVSLCLPRVGAEKMGTKANGW